MHHNILIIDNNPDMAERGNAEWKKHGGCITNVYTASEAIQELRNKEYHLVVMVKDYIKDQLLSAIDAIYSATDQPILVVTSQYDKDEKLAALRIGADGYIRRAGPLEEVIVIASALMRRYRRTRVKEENDYLVFREIKLDRHGKKVFADGNSVPLTRSEYNCLELLMSHPGRVFSYDVIYYHTYGEEANTDNIIAAVRGIITRIRNKLGPAYAEYIKTRRGLGFMIDNMT